ncbi:putative porin [uncultured Bacteroides sp.]|uniref:putative porin n=1 Tax=uncultured Bacteroides sp. TaxID=162156 RepID=UPI00260D570A|nr:putative porin [uncultured Bacteroides sp.]
MRRILLTSILLFVLGLLTAQAQRMLNTLDNRDPNGNQIDPSRQPDSLDTGVDVQSIPPKLYMWRLSETLGNRTIIPADTANLNFQNTNLGTGMTGQYNTLGNLGSPRLSRIFFDRTSEEPTIFMAPFSSFFVHPDQMLFTNSNVPYTNLTYYKAGNKISGEERFKSYFSVNVNKRLAFGFKFDYLYGRGYYTNQSTAHFNAGIFGSYIGERYQLQAVYNNFYLKMNENGGITNDGYITRPDTMAEGKKQYESTTIPVNMEQASNRNKDFYVYLTQRYRMGFTRKVMKEQSDSNVPQQDFAASNATMPTRKQQPSLASDSLNMPPALTADSLLTDSLMQVNNIRQDSIKNSATLADNGNLVEEFVPVTSFIHTFKVERLRHRFQAVESPNANANYNKFGVSRDSTTAFSVKNVFGIALLEGFNKYAKAGLTAYLSHKFSRYDLMNQDSITTDRFTEQEIYVGGELAKRQGKTLHYSIDGEIGIMDKALGQFQVNGNMDLNFRLWKDTVNLMVRGFVKNTLPSFYMRHYHSNQFIWDNNDMEKEFRTRVEGELNIDRWGTNLRAGVENIKNYTYFNQNAVPAQYSGNIQVISAILNQNFRIGIFHLDNEVVWQQSSNETLLPLPKLSLYSNFYILTKLAKKVLTVQVGADVRYFTKYHAPAYTPAIQQFHLQPDDDQVEIGGYPIVNIYANIHLKRTRLFAMYSHVNQGMGTRNSFLVPHYPINPSLLRVGVSWNFYD